MKLLTQIAVVFGVCLAGELVSALLPFVFPASVISMLLLFFLLLSGLLKPEQIAEKTDFLLKNMAFFFIPAGVGIAESFSEVKASILPLLAVCVITTILTFAATAFTVTAVIRIQNRLRGLK